MERQKKVQIGLAVGEQNEQERKEKWDFLVIVILERNQPALTLTMILSSSSSWSSSSSSSHYLSHILSFTVTFRFIPYPLHVASFVWKLFNGRKENCVFVYLTGCLWVRVKVESTPLSRSWPTRMWKAYLLQW